MFAEVPIGETIMATFEAGPIWCCLSYSRKVARVMLVDKHFGKQDMKFMDDTVLTAFWSVGAILLMGELEWMMSSILRTCKSQKSFQFPFKLSLNFISLGITEMNSGKSTKIYLQRLKLDQFQSFSISQFDKLPTPYTEDWFVFNSEEICEGLPCEQREIWKIQKSFNFLSPLILIRSNHVTYRWWDKLQANEKKSKAQKSSNTRIDWGQVLRGTQSMSWGMRGIIAKVAHWIKS